MGARHCILPMLSILCLSCGAIRPGQHNEGGVPQAAAGVPPVNIVGGTPVTNEDWQAAHTVVLLDDSGHAFCTATRVGPNHLVTAAHCIENPIPRMAIGHGVLHGFIATTEQGETRASAWASTRSSSSVKVIAAIAHPAYNVTDSSGKGSDFQDIGLIVFTGDFSAAVTPIAGFADFPLKTRDLGEDSVLVKAGYGATSDRDQSAARLRTVDLQVVRLDPKNFELEYRRGTGKGTCYGDSGGPGFVTNSGISKLVGITSRGPEVERLRRFDTSEAGCDEGNGVDTDARYYRAWLDCTARALYERFTGEGLALDPLDVELEKGDISDRYCNKNRIESLAEAYQRVKDSCASRQEHVYDETSGTCAATTKKACDKDGGSWDKKSKDCRI